MKKITLASFVLVAIAGVASFFLQSKYGATHNSKALTNAPLVPTSTQADVVAASPNRNFLDGVYSLEKSSPYESGWVSVSSSTNEELFYHIETAMRGESGAISGVAVKSKISPSLMYVGQGYDAKGGDQEGCKVTLVFSGKGELYYTAEDEKIATTTKDEYNPGCSNYLGAHARFFSRLKHVRDLPDESATLIDLGFTKEDREAFKKLDDADFNALDAEVYGRESMQSRGDSDMLSSSTQRLASKDIVNMFGYSIESARLYNRRPCDYGVNGNGECVYGAFLKNDKGGYWLMGGGNYISANNADGSKNTNSKTFIYRTTEKEWKHKLPMAFKSELTRLGLKVSDVDFEK